MEQPTTPLSSFASHLTGAFGSSTFGRRAETFARFFGTPRFLIGQTILVIGWIALNGLAASQRWDPYPFILLNLAFSLQAAYAAPLILLAQTRQADRDKTISDADNAHREVLAATALEGQANVAIQNDKLQELLEVNTTLTRQIEQLTTEIHNRVVNQPGLA